jgi:CHAD domain-containing protein
VTVERPTEVELKYRVSSTAGAERLLNGEELGPFEADGAVHTTESEDRYVDTRDGLLAKAGYAARLRRTRATTIVSVKSLAMADGALQRRTELEGPADRTRPPAEWPHSPARSFILELCGDVPLQELVTVRQTRRKRMFRADGSRVELSLDEVEVIQRATPLDRFTELEVELVDGPEAPLLELRALLVTDAALAPSTASKLDAALAAVNSRRSGRAGSVRESGGARRGERVRERTPRAESKETLDPAAQPTAEATPVASAPPPVAALPGTASIDQPAAPDAEETLPALEAPALEAPATEAPTRSSAAEAMGLIVGKTPGVTADDVVAEAGRKVLRFHLARLIAREAGTRSGEDPEDLHAMRVATRRMRAAWRVFGDGFRTDGTRKFRNRLRDVARRLGAVRDIDVLVMGLEDYRAGLPAAERTALEPLFADWREQREAARLVLMRELDSDGHRRFIEDYRVFVLTPGAGALVVSPTDPHHVRDTAGSRIWQAYEHVLAYGPVLRWADVPTLHQLRIAGKWLRYTLEFVAEALGPEAKPLIERVVAMQDHLGLMNDAEVSAMKARALLVARSGTLSDAQTAAIARYLTSREGDVARLKRGAAAPWRVVASPTFRRALGRSVATLSAVSGPPGG